MEQLRRFAIDLDGAFFNRQARQVTHVIDISN
jgi:hypothetical protein